MSPVTEFRLGKGLTNRPTEQEVWSKRYLEFTVKMPNKFTDKDLQAAILATEYAIDNYLGQPDAAATQQIPEFDPALLMNHPWKGKKLGDNQYEQGSTAWGWDFRDKFPKEVIDVLKKGPLTIDKYEFALSENLVSAKEKKGSKQR